MLALLFKFIHLFLCCTRAACQKNINRANLIFTFLPALLGLTDFSCT